MKKKAKLTLLLSLSIIILSFQLSNAQNISPLFLNAKDSKNGLEVENYKKVEIVIEELSEGAKRIGLTRERIQTKCELRLRQAGLEPVKLKPFAYLYILIHVVDRSFHESIGFYRLIYFQVNEIWYSRFSCPTWATQTNGEHGGNPDLIIQSLDQDLDLFLNEYLKANAK